MKTVRLAFILALFLAPWARVAIGQDQVQLKFGTWKLNMQKSKIRRPHR